MQIKRCGNGGGSTAGSRRRRGATARVERKVDDRDMGLVELLSFLCMLLLRRMLVLMLLRRVGVTTTRGFFSVGSGTSLVSSEQLGLCRSFARSRVAAMTVNHRFWGLVAKRCCLKAKAHELVGTQRRARQALCGKRKGNGLDGVLTGNSNPEGCEREEGLSYAG